MAEEKWLVNGPQIIEVDDIRRLKVGLVAGQVDIVAHDRAGVRIEVHAVDGKDLKIRRTGGDLEIDHPQLGWDNWLDVFRSFRGRDRADVSVMVPRDVALKLGLVSARGLVSGIRPPAGSTATISTVSGDVVVDGVEGDITVNSVSGELAIQGHRGRISAHTVSGDLAVRGEVVLFTSDGVSGDVYLDLAGVPDELRINTVSGAVTAGLGADAGAQYTINTVSGRIQLDEARITGVHGRYTSRYGQLERQWTDIVVNTVSGDINVLHAVRA